MMMNFEGVYLKFHQQISDIGYDAKAASVEVSHFPVPTVILGGVEIPGVFAAQKVSLKFSILSILTFNPSITMMEASDVKINADGASMIHHDVSIVRMFRILPKLPNVDLKRVLLVDNHSGAVNNAQLVQIRPDSNFNNIMFRWADSSYTNISYKQKDYLEVKILTVAPTYKVEVLETYDVGFKFASGAVNYSIDNLKDYVNNHYRDLDLLVTQIASTEPAKITCDFMPTNNGISMSNINLKSDSITMTGAADFFDGTKQDIVNLHFTDLNLTKLLKTPDMESINLSKNKEVLQLKNLNSIINITADNVALSGFLIKGVKLSASSDGTKLNIAECSGDLQGEGKFDLLGVVTQNQYRSKFDGKINMTYQNANDLMSKLGYASDVSKQVPISLTSDIIATPVDYKFTNLYTKIGQLSVNGSAALKLIGTTPRLNLALNFSQVDFAKNEYNTISSITNYFQSLAMDMQNKDYLNKYIPLRKIGYLGNFDITLTNPVIAGKVLDKIHFICDASSGLLDFTSLYYQNGPNYLVGNGKLISTGIKPLMSLRITDGEIYDNSLSLENLVNGLNEANTKYSFDKVTLDFAIALKNLREGKSDIQNFYVAAINQDKLFNISGLQGVYKNSTFTSSGSLFLDALTLNLAYAYSNFNINDVNALYPIGIFGIQDGWVSSNGTISTHGDTIAKLLYNLYTKSDFVASAVKWEGFDIDGFVKAINVLNYDPNNLATDAISFASTGTSNIPKMSGSYNIERGVIKFSDVKFNTDRTSSSAVASYNIYDSSIDTTLTSTLSLASKASYRPSSSVDMIIHNYGNISTVKREINLDAIKQILSK